MEEPQARSRWLVETDWLAERLGEPGLRIIDSTLVVTRMEGGGWRPSSGRESYEAGHIPGAQFVDLTIELFDASSPTGYMLSALELVAKTG